MRLLDKATSAALVKLIIFMVITTMATAVLVVLIGNLTFQSSRDYKADFTDVTGVVKGDDVRIAGVKVGSVKSVEVVGADHARVEFDVADSATVTKSSTATIRYRNLVGQRYIAISQGVGNTDRLPEDAVIPRDRTTPALDLTELFNGFKPLFKALSPEDINKLSTEMIAVFQGQGGNLQGLLQNTASVTSTRMPQPSEGTAIARSAEATSGRRSSDSEGTPIGMAGGPSSGEVPFTAHRSTWHPAAR